MSDLYLCKFGKVDGDCHKVWYIRKNGYVKVAELDSTERRLIQWRSEEQLCDSDVICFHHKQVYLTRYESLQKCCCDPYEVHQKKIFGWYTYFL